MSKDNKDIDMNTEEIQKNDEPELEEATDEDIQKAMDEIDWHKLIHDTIHETYTDEELAEIDRRTDEMFDRASKAKTEQEKMKIFYEYEPDTVEIGEDGIYRNKIGI
jgi:hypothetical protein